ncbi:hypothetical protein SAMN05518871_103354 [Psychrobacillus sp. OK028]|uniref:DUF5694 domain-containing protein n=1 Tax=Psychrobacillus sp. OK028 TaxID=1884359 RepID=UPI00088859F3|nr:DUF5694 domain-containing protein [Psychrobacillus sp. OK028]SDN12323.1 hypothetical protein SAMN05518871_103354 [Psychrobacillus sp. OK028]
MNKHKAQVLVLGTFHMNDYAELHAQKRQDEIEEVITNLVNFKPTKIAVEMVVEKNIDLKNKYKQYISGEYTLEMNEIYQVGFRIASRLGHEQLYAVDWMGEAEMDYVEVEKWLKENQPELFKEIFDGLYLPELTSNKSVLAYYRELNEPFWLNQLHKLYLNMARIGDFDNYIGMKWLSWWYKRNLIIYSNLSRIANSKEERILLIVGSSHSSIITKFLEESEAFEIVKPLDYLT